LPQGLDSQSSKAMVQMPLVAEYRALLEATQGLDALIGSSVVRGPSLLGAPIATRAGIGRAPASQVGNIGQRVTRAIGAIHRRREPFLIARAGCGADEPSDIGRSTAVNAYVDQPRSTRVLA